MGDVTFNCFENPEDSETPPEHIWICCGFEKMPTTLTVDWALDGASALDPACIALYGGGGTGTVFTKSTCGVVYSNPSLPFSVNIGTPVYCIGNPNAANSHINSWGFSPGSPSYDSGNYCLRNPATGAIAFSLCADNVGSPCTFRVCVTGAS